MKIPLKKIEIQFSNGEFGSVHAPRMQDLPTFVRALPAIMAVGNAFEMAQQNGNPPLLTDTDMDAIYQMLSIMSDDITGDDFKEFPMFDGFAILSAIEQFVPKNLKADQGTSAG